MGDIALADGGRAGGGRPLSAPWCTATGRSGAPAAGTWPPSRCGPPGPRARSPGRPASSATTSRWPSFAPVDLVVTPLRAGRTVLAQRVAMTQEGRPVLDAMVWSVGDVEGLEHEDADPARRARPRRAADVGRPAAPDEDRPHMPVLGQLRPAAARLVGEWPPPGPLPPTWRTWVRRSPRRPSTTPGWTRRARSSCSTWGAGPRARGRTCTSSRRSSHRASTSTPSFQYPGARRSGCCSTRTRRWPRAACSRGPAGSGRGSGGCSPAAAARRSSGTPSDAAARPYSAV